MSSEITAWMLVSLFRPSFAQSNWASGDKFRTRSEDYFVKIILMLKNTQYLMKYIKKSSEIYCRHVQLINNHICIVLKSFDRKTEGNIWLIKYSKLELYSVSLVPGLLLTIKSNGFISKLLKHVLSDVIILYTPKFLFTDLETTLDWASVV